MLSGCDLISNNSETIETEVESEEKVEMTERQEAVFRSYGLEEERIAKMKEEGLNYKEQSFVDTAIIMLDYLEEKYGETFEVVGGDIPGILSDEYWITAQALEGEHAGERFEVYFRGEAGCTDGYINILKEDEAVEALKNLMHEKFNDVYVSAEITGEYGKDVTVDMTGEQLLNIVSYAYDLIFTAPDMTEEAFLERAEEIETYLDDNDVFSSGNIFCFVNEIEPEMSDDEIMNLIEENAGTNNVVKWYDYISTR
jgi:hypothetical protein